MNAASANSRQIFYGWWVTLAAFLNLFFAVGIVFWAVGERSRRRGLVGTIVPGEESESAPT